MISPFFLLGGDVPARASLLPSTQPKDSTASATLPQPSCLALQQEKA